MAIVTGTLQDIGQKPMTGKRARIIFTPDQPSVRGGVLTSTAEVVAEVGGNGSFTADLQPSMATNPPTPLKVAIEWFDDGGSYKNTDYITNWRVVVRDEGGNIGSQIAVVGGGVISTKPDRADIDESVNRVLPIALASSTAIVEAGRIAAENALRAADLLVGSEHRAPKTGQDDAFRIRDIEGKVAFAVNPDGSVGLGDTDVKAGDGFRIRDRDGQVAFEVTPDGRTHVYDPAFTTGGNGGGSGVVDTLHVFLAAGQSNMSGRGVPDAADKPDGRIFQYGATRRRLEVATVPLDMHDTSTGISPATTFARNYLKMQPSNVGVLLIPAAHGGTGFTSSANTLTWTVGAASAPEYDLPAKAVAQTLAAIEAARAAGYAVSLEGMLWHQGENNGSMSTAVYASALDRLVSHLRSSLASPRLPFVVGQMVPDGTDKSEDRQGIDRAHSQTPVRVAHTGFAAALRGGYNTGDTTHMNREGVVHMGRTMLAAFWHAVGNALTAPPAPVANLQAAKAGTAVTVSWMAPPVNLTQSAAFDLNTGGNSYVWSAPQAHITGYKVEAKTGAAAWVTVNRAWAPAIAETFTAPAGATQVRVTAMNGSTESAPVTVTAVGA